MSPEPVGGKGALRSSSALTVLAKGRYLPSNSMPWRCAIASTASMTDAAVGCQSRRSTREVLHRSARRVYHEGHGIRIGLVADGVRCSAGKRDSLANSDTHPLCR